MTGIPEIPGPLPTSLPGMPLTREMIETAAAAVRNATNPAERAAALNTLHDMRAKQLERLKAAEDAALIAGQWGKVRDYEESMRAHVVGVVMEAESGR